MKRSPGSLILALVWAFVAALSAPGLAVAHGEAHHHRAEAAHAQAHELAREHEHDDHEHPELAAPVGSGRVDLAPAVITATVVAPLANVATVRTALIDTRVSVRDGPPPDSPRQPRAPPLG